MVSKAREDLPDPESPPNLGILTVNILTASDGIIIPALADIFSLQGVGQLYSTIQAVKTYCNPGLEIYGILLVRHTDRFILHRSMRDMLEETARQIGTQVFRAAMVHLYFNIIGVSIFLIEGLRTAALAAHDAVESRFQTVGLLVGETQFGPEAEVVGEEGFHLFP